MRMRRRTLVSMRIAAILVLVSACAGVVERPDARVEDADMVDTDTAAEGGSATCAPDETLVTGGEHCADNCSMWARALAPAGDVGFATCIIQTATPLPQRCIRATMCDASTGTCQCGAGPECGSGEVCVQTPDGRIGCVCAASGP